MPSFLTARLERLENKILAPKKQGHVISPNREPASARALRMHNYQQRWRRLIAPNLLCASDACRNASPTLEFPNVCCQRRQRESGTALPNWRGAPERTKIWHLWPLSGQWRELPANTRCFTGLWLQTKGRKGRTMRHVDRFLFAVAAAFLIFLAALLIGYSGYQVWKTIATAGQVLAAGDFGYIVINSVGYVVIAIAILDVAKHLLEEEVLAWREPHRATNFRRNFSRFISIILIAIFLEGLVLVFKVTQDDIKLMVYPVLLLSAGVAMMIGLAVFQRLGSDPGKAGTGLE